MKTDENQEFTGLARESLSGNVWVLGPQIAEQLMRQGYSHRKVTDIHHVRLHAQVEGELGLSSSVRRSRFASERGRFAGQVRNCHRSLVRSQAAGKAYRERFAVRGRSLRKEELRAWLFGGSPAQCSAGIGQKQWRA